MLGWIKRKLRDRLWREDARLASLKRELEDRLPPSEAELVELMKRGAIRRSEGTTSLPSEALDTFVVNAPVFTGGLYDGRRVRFTVYGRRIVPESIHVWRPS